MALEKLTAGYLPEAGDVLGKNGDDRRLYVDDVSHGEVLYRLTDGHGGLLEPCRRPVMEFIQLALEQELCQVTA